MCPLPFAGFPGRRKEGVRGGRKKWSHGRWRGEGGHWVDTQNVLVALHSARLLMGIP